MQFAMFIYQGSTPLPNTDAWEQLPEDEQKKIYADYSALNDNPGVTPGVPLGLPAKAKTVRVDKDKIAATDGPFRGVDEAIGGYFVLEAEDEAAAIQLAATLPPARHGGAIEIRPVETYW